MRKLLFVSILFMLAQLAVSFACREALRAVVHDPLLSCRIDAYRIGLTDGTSIFFQFGMRQKADGS